MKYLVKTRNWHGKQWCHKLLAITKILGVKIDSEDFKDAKFFLNTVRMVSRILGFDANGCAYILWDCYWSPIDLVERKALKMSWDYVIEDFVN